MAGAASTLGRPETPVRDRLITTLFVAALLHALVILGVTFTSGDEDGPGAPGLQVLLLPEDDLNLACLLKSPLLGLSEEQVGELEDRGLLGFKDRPAR